MNRRAFSARQEALIAAASWEQVIVLCDQADRYNKYRRTPQVWLGRGLAHFELGQLWRAWVESALGRDLAEQSGPLAELWVHRDRRIRATLPQGPMPQEALEPLVATGLFYLTRFITTLIELDRGLTTELRLLRYLSVPSHLRGDSEQADLDHVVQARPGSYLAFERRIAQEVDPAHQLELVERALDRLASDTHRNPIDQLYRQVRPFQYNQGTLSNTRLKLHRALGNTEELRRLERIGRVEMIEDEVASARANHMSWPDEVEDLLAGVLGLVKEDRFDARAVQGTVEHVLRSWPQDALEGEVWQLVAAVLGVASGEPDNGHVMRLEEERLGG